MASAAQNHDNDTDQLGDQALAHERRREAVLKLTMSERLELLDSLCRHLNEIKGIAKR